MPAIAPESAASGGRRPRGGRGSTGPSDDESDQPADEVLLDACRRGDAGAWRALYDRHKHIVYAIPKSYGLSDADAADVVQMSFAALLQGLDDLESAGAVRAWLITVARRQSWRLRARGRQESGHLAADAADPDEPTAVLERIEWLSAGLAELSPKCRDLLIALYFGAPRSYAAVATRLEMPIGSIGPTRARCLERLRRILEAAEADSGDGA